MFENLCTICNFFVCQFVISFSCDHRHRPLSQLNFDIVFPPNNSQIALVATTFLAICIESKRFGHQSPIFSSSIVLYHSMRSKSGTLTVENLLVLNVCSRLESDINHAISGQSSCAQYFFWRIHNSLRRKNSGNLITVILRSYRLIPLPLFPLFHFSEVYIRI